MTIAETAGNAAAFSDGFEELAGKAVGLVGEIGPVEKHGNAGDFPVAAGRVFAGADLAGVGEGAGKLGGMG